jgi:hypothetical protein
MTIQSARYAFPEFKLAAVCWPGGVSRPSSNMRTRVHVPEGTHVTLLARAYTEDRTGLQQSEVDSITLRVYEQPSNAPASEVYSTTLTIASVVFDTMQTDARWAGDSVGYNFRYTVDAEQLLGRGGVTTIYEVTIELASGGPIKQAWEVHAAPMLSPA